MADEFIKGLGVLTGAGLLWMVFSGWYATPSFEEKQLVHAIDTATLGEFGNLALTFREAMFWAAVIGALTFWVLIPAARQARTAIDSTE